MDKKTAYFIIKAQMCSDSGKHLNYQYGHPGWKDRTDKFGYSSKTWFIIKAMNRISQLHGTSGFHYYIGTDNTQIKYTTVVYFNFKIDNEKFQISFHCEDYDIPDRYLKNNTSHYTRWDHKSSREACEALSAWIG